jgi:hypothetical protein
MPLPIYVNETELWDSERRMFIKTKPHKLVLEHSLISISKWEAKHHKMWLETKDKTGQELLDYIRCMTINGDVPETVYYALSNKNLTDILEYMDDPMTASSVYDPPRAGHKELISSELIYYWMLQFNIPFECEKWHINRLLMLIKICSRKSTPLSKADKKAMDQRRAAINAERKARLKTKG